MAGKEWRGRNGGEGMAGKSVYNQRKIVLQLLYTAISDNKPRLTTNGHTQTDTHT